VRVIDDTKADIERLIAADFGKSTSEDYQSDFVSWLHYRARRMPRLHRKVFLSQEIKLHLPSYPAITKIRGNLEQGGNLEPWLRIEKRKPDHRADMMFNDWMIQHFHLGEVFQSPSVIKRTGPLLFAHISAEEATLIDVQPHGSWSMIRLLETLLATNPGALQQYEARGVTPYRLSDEEYKNLRSKNINVALDVAGRAFMPGGGKLTSGHAMRIYFYRDWFFRQLEHLQATLSAGVIEPHLRTAIYARLGVPVRLGVYYDDNGLAIIDKNRNGLVLHKMKPIE
jgi:hypothetical protein